MSSVVSFNQTHNQNQDQNEGGEFVRNITIQGLTPTERTYLDLVEDHPGRSRAWYAEEMDVDHSTAKQHLQNLANTRLVQERPWDLNMVIYYTGEDAPATFRLQPPGSRQYWPIRVLEYASAITDRSITMDRSGLHSIRYATGIHHETQYNYDEKFLLPKDLIHYNGRKAPMPSVHLAEAIREWWSKIQGPTTPYNLPYWTDPCHPRPRDQTAPCNQGVGE